jgi:hypothetical protein
MKYTILQSTKLEELIALVNQHISVGWLPLGGVSTSTAIMATTLFCQAMTKDQTQK